MTFKLKNNTIEICPILRIKEEKRGQLEKTNVFIEEKSLLAADHAEIIYYGMKNLLKI